MSEGTALLLVDLEVAVFGGFGSTARARELEGARLSSTDGLVGWLRSKCPDR